MTILEWTYSITAPLAKMKSEQAFGNIEAHRVLINFVWIFQRTETQIAT